MTMDRMRKAPARLLIDRASGVSVRLYWGPSASRIKRPALSLEPAKAFWEKAVKEEDRLYNVDPPYFFTVNEQLARSRANIRRRATKVRPRLKGG